MKSAFLSFIVYLSSFIFCSSAEPVRILAIGDSITQGGKTFVTYRLPLDRKLRAAGLRYEFVGTQQSEGPHGPLWHEGYGGKNAEFLAGIMPQKLKQLQPDIILLHCGHNHFAEEKPVAGILAAERAIIEAARKQNPKVVVLLAQVITSGKLPKYGYLPELNQAQVLAGPGTDPGRLARRDRRPGDRFRPAEGHHPGQGPPQRPRGRKDG
jgi:lysophospholipase L1-like esterase